ncbi:MAG: hypothetical protein Q9217_003611 [Psora testacea]
MADLDEDAVKRTNVDTENTDISDETQDFRFLSSLSQHTSDHPTLPRRGEKDFERHGTRLQEDVLSASRQAMHAALSYPRLHKPQSLTGSFNHCDGSCIIQEPRGPNLQNMGKGDSEGCLHLLPEEALYLVERGTLNLQWQDEELDGVPLSLQAAYAQLIGTEGLTLERYNVYAGLKRSGYIIQRAPTWYPEDHDKIIMPLHPTPPPIPTSIYNRLHALLFPAMPPTDPPPLGPLVQPGLYRSYAPIYRRLALIPFHDPTVPPSPPSAPPCHPLIRPTYHVWKPTLSFRKTAPPPPDYRVCVLNARTDPFPVLDQLDDLMRCMPYEPPPAWSEGKTYVRLRHGYKSVILAVVDQGIVSYVRIGDAGFGVEPVWNRGVGRAGKSRRGGRRPLRGKGRGGGRGNVLH